MDSRSSVIDGIGRAGLVAIFRSGTTDGLRDAALSLVAGGAPVVEVTLTTPGAFDLISDLAAEDDSGLVVGAGTVLNATDCRAAIDAGASFVVSPVLDHEVLGLCRECDVVAVMGCLTPTEVVTATREGTDIVKLFPGRLATPDYVRDLLEPLPGTRLLPTGRVDLAAAAAYVRCGAFAVGAGTNLVDPATVRARDWAAITERALSFRSTIDEARAALQPVDR